jgi:hypothetical protein
MRPTAWSASTRRRIGYPPEPEVLLDGQIGKDRAVLQDVPDRCVPQLRVGAQTRHVAAVDPDAAAADVGEPEHGVQHRGFLGAVRADQAERLADVQLEIEPMDNFRLAVADGQPI